MHRENGFSPAWPVSVLTGILALAFCLLATFSAAQSYLIRPGDQLRVEVLEDPSLNRTVLVAPDGRISVSSAGSMRVSGMSVDSVKRAITNRIASDFASPPNVYVGLQNLGERRTADPEAPEVVSVFVLGESKKPGRLDLEPGTSVLQAFAMMGGFTNFAATKRIQLRRVDPQTGAERIYLLNYNQIEQGSAAGRTTMLDGDVIVIPQRRLFE